MYHRHVLALACACSLAACSPPDSNEPGADTGAPSDAGTRDAGARDSGPSDTRSDYTPADPVSLEAGDWRIDVDFAARSISWGEPGQDALLSFPADGIVLGEVSEIDENASYDPFRILGEGLGRPPRVSGWRALTRLEPSEDTDGPLTLIATFEEGLRAEITLIRAADGRVSMKITPDAASAPKVGFMRLVPVVSATEGFYGLGEYFDNVDHRGHVRAMHRFPVNDVESGYNEAHVPIPFITGTRGWGMFVENPAPAAFGVATEADDRVDAIFGTGVNSPGGLLVHLFAAPHPLDVTKHFYDVTGQPKLPARWTYGPLVWRDENDDQAQFVSDLQIMRDLDLATSGVWIDRPYATDVNTFDFEVNDWPDPQSMVDFAHDMGFRVGLWHVPYVDDDSPATADLFAEATEKGYYPLEAGIALNQWGPALDLTNPEARTWWQGNLKKYTDMGFEGYKLDYMEDVVPGLLGARTPWVFHDGTDERTQHQRYQLVYHSTYAETLDPDAPFLLCRSATWGDQSLGVIIWPGDLDANFAYHKEKATNRDGEEYNAVGGLPASLVAGLGLGASGFPFYGADTGGYRHSPTPKEVFTRWFQQTALSTVMQIGTSANDVAWEFKPENGFDQEMLDLYRIYTRLHLRLFPYVWSYAALLDDDGRAIQRPLGLAYPELGVHPDDTYMMGDHLLVSPVVREGQTTKTFTAPPGHWIDWWTGEVYEGGKELTVDAPLETLPLFVAAGGIVPMLRPTIDTLSPVADPDAVDSYATTPGRLHVRLGARQNQAALPVSFTLYDDASVTYGPGEDADELVSLTSGSEFAHGWALEFVGRDVAPEAVSADGQALTAAADLAALDASDSGYFFDDSGAQPILHVRVRASVAEVTVTPGS